MCEQLPCSRRAPGEPTCLAFTASALFLAAPAFAADLHVPSQYPTIQAALTAALPGDTVIVADGVYVGTGNKGLFLGSKTVTLTSSGGAAKCILDMQGSGTAFFLVADEPPTTTIRGFTIQNGNFTNGGAVFLHHGGSPTFADCVFQDNDASRGGAVYSENSSHATFVGCTFVGNTAQYGGAAYAGDLSAPRFVGCTFTGNTATVEGGGIMFQTAGTSPEVASSVLVGNFGAQLGGGILASTGKPRVRGCTIAANTSARGGGLAVRGLADAELGSSIVWSNVAATAAEIALVDSAALGGAKLAVSYSDVQGGAAAAAVDPLSTLVLGPGNIDADPLFADLPALDARLRGGSPAIDAADPGFVADPALPYDALGFGHLRIDDGDFDLLERLDMGAIEFGGLLGDPEVSVGGTALLELWGPPGAPYAVFLGVPGAPFDLGGLGTAFLALSPLIPLAAGALPPSGTAIAWSAVVPPGLLGDTSEFQAARIDPAGAHLTNLERTLVVP